MRHCCDVLAQTCHCLMVATCLHKFAIDMLQDVKEKLTDQEVHLIFGYWLTYFSFHPRPESPEQQELHLQAQSSLRQALLGLPRTKSLMHWVTGNLHLGLPFGNDDTPEGQISKVRQLPLVGLSHPKLCSFSNGEHC